MGAMAGAGLAQRRPRARSSGSHLAGSRITALAWKNLAAFVRLGVSFRFLFVGLMMIGSAVVTVLTGNRHGPAGEGTGTLLLMFAGLVAVFGPLLWRFDLRRDLAMLDVLKVYPLRGTEIVAGELLAPLGVLGTATCTFLIAGPRARERDRRRWLRAHVARLFLCWW